MRNLVNNADTNVAYGCRVPQELPRLSACYNVLWNAEVCYANPKNGKQYHMRWKEEEHTPSWINRLETVKSKSSSSPWLNVAVWTEHCSRDLCCISNIYIVYIQTFILRILYTAGNCTLESKDNLHKDKVNNKYFFILYLNVFENNTQDIIYTDQA